MNTFHPVYRSEFRTYCRNNPSGPACRFWKTHGTSGVKPSTIAGRAVITNTVIELVIVRVAKARQKQKHACHAYQPICTRHLHAHHKQYLRQKPPSEKHLICHHSSMPQTSISAGDEPRQQPGSAHNVTGCRPATLC